MPHVSSLMGGGRSRPLPPNFFIFGVYAQPTSSFAKWIGRGINTLVEVPQGSDPAAWTELAEDAELWIMRPPLGTDSEGPTSTFLTTDQEAFDNDNSSKLIAHTLMDEPSNGSPVDYPYVAHTPEYVDTIARGWRVKGKPLWINHIGNHINNAFITGIMSDYLDSPRIDWFSHDSYPVQAEDPLAYEQDGCFSTHQGHAIDRMAEWSNGKPQMAFIGTSSFEASDPVTTRAQMRMQIWSSIIHGAPGILYFTIEFNGFVFVSFDGTPTRLVAEMEAVHADITEIEDVLMSPDGGRRASRIFRSCLEGEEPTADQLPYPFEACTIDRGELGVFKILLNLTDAPATLTYAPWGIVAQTYAPYEKAMGYTAEELAPATYEGPGDVVPGAEQWGGLRAYDYDLIGNPVLDIVRASDAEEEAFISLADGSLDVASITTFLSGTTGKCSKLYDQPGGNHWVQAIDAARPDFTFDGGDGLPCLTFSGAQELVSIDNVSAINATTISAVAMRTGNFTANGGILGTQDFDTLLFFFAAVDLIKIYSNPSDHFAFAVDNLWHAITGVFTSAGTSSSLTVDGETTTGTIGTTDYGASGTKSVIGNAAGADFFLTGKFREGGVWPFNFSGPQTANIDINKRTYWDLY